MRYEEPKTQESHERRPRRRIESAVERLREIDTNNLFLQAVISDLLDAVQKRARFDRNARKALFLLQSVPLNSDRDRGKMRDAMQLLVAVQEELQ